MQRISAEIALPDLAATEALGARIAGGLRAGDAVALAGDLGAGKTALARAVLRALGVAEDVPSPTFTLVQIYETPALTVSHFDLYRIKSESELDELGFDDALAAGAALIEWPERAPHRIPDDALHVALASTGEGARLATLSGPRRWAHLAEAAHVR
ncbi:MAG: tRNA (adenosine(37)-N6)-threonylcarbamoyltransferase complex ATPase subunit type 1 TsaE [Rhizomicrobium sp.]